MPVQPEVTARLAALEVTYEALDCDPDFADTTDFCEHYGYAPETAANTIVVASKRPPGRFVACLVLATTRLDVNGKVREVTGWKKASFARPEETAQLTGMMIGGVTPFALPGEVPLLVDSAVMERPWIIIGAGSRSAKLKIEPSMLEKTGSVRVIEGLANSFIP